MHNLIFCLMGPSACGKTNIAFELIKEFPFEIVSVDSALIYREMDIGTAKPDKAILQEIPHNLVDILNPIESYSVANFLKDVNIICKNIWRRNKIPLLVGGTMMYFRALQEGLLQLPQTNLTIRDKILNEAKEKGWIYLHNKLRDVDLITAEKIHPNDSQRIGRALEIFLSSGKPMSSYCVNQPGLNANFINLMLIPEDRKILHAQIAQRFVEMLDNGFVNEVKAILEKWSLDLSYPALRAVGYRQVFEYLMNQYDYNSLLEKGISATRQLAKRQLTWLRSWHAGTNLSFTMESPGLQGDIVAKIQEILDNEQI